MDVRTIYHSVEKKIKQIDFHALHPDFKPYRFALYDHAMVCLEGELFPYEDIFRGNTSIEYRGEPIAIWDLDLEEKIDTELLAYGIIHEMYHCFQRENQEIRYPDDLKLLCYPADIINFSAKYQENLQLIQAYQNQDRQALKRFYTIRNARYIKYGESIREEWKAETLEGMAEYIGLKALKQIQKEKYQTIIRQYMEWLQQDISLLFDARRISYYTGTLFYLTLDRLGIPIENKFSEQTVYEQNLLYTDKIYDMEENPHIAAEYDNFVRHRNQILKEHLAGSAYTEWGSQICGYDPMNMFRAGDWIDCSHFAALQRGTERIFLEGPVVLKSVENSTNEVEGYFVKKGYLMRKNIIKDI